jgi:cytochrome c peroxidase
MQIGSEQARARGWAAAVFLGIVALTVWVGANPAAGDAADLREMKAKYQRPATISFPAENKYTKERAELGRTLFFDPRLSSSQIMSCATCHNPAMSWGDGLPKAVGHGMQQLGRRTPTILNLADAERLFWDGRAESLEQQALGPIEAPGEMNLPLPKALEILRGIAGYRTMFELAYPGEGITAATLGKAIATFERTVVSGDAPFDEWIAGREDAISESAKRGFVVFNTKGNCAKCHTGWNFTDHSFHDLGMKDDDLGRGKLLPRLERMQHAFKTPTLRNVVDRRPYMHDGSLATLEQVIDYYDRGGDAKRPGLAPEIKTLALTAAEKQDLVAFMRTLTSADAPVQIPTLPR